MENNELKKYEDGLVKRVNNAISVTNKLLALTEPKLIPYRKKDKWGYCTADKKIIIDCVYDGAGRFYNGVARVGKSGNYGYINKLGIITIDFPTSTSIQVSEDIQLGEDIPNKFEAFSTRKRFKRDVEINSFKRDGKYGFVDVEGKEIISSIYDLSEEFYEGLAKVKFNGKWGYINKQGVQYWED